MRVTLTGVFAPVATTTAVVVPVRAAFVVRVTVTVYGLPVGIAVIVGITPAALVVPVPFALYEYGPPVTVQLYARALHVVPPDFLTVMMMPPCRYAARLIVTFVVAPVATVWLVTVVVWP